MTDMRPSVSIVVPCFNAAWVLPKLARCIESIAPEAAEVIVVDDGSSDGSAELVNQLLPQATVIRQANAGVGAARNRGAEMATGEFIQFLDADDTIEPGKLTGQAQFGAAVGADVVYSGWRMVIVEDGMEGFGSWEEGAAEGEIAEALLGGWWFPTVAALVRRSAFLSIGGCDPTLKNTCDDFHVWAQLAIAGSKYAYAPGRWANYHRYVHVNSLSRVNSEEFFRGEAIMIRNAVSELTRRNALTVGRRQAAARRLYLVAQNVRSVDRLWFERLREEVFRLDPDFTPGGSLLFRLAAKTLGLDATEAIASWRRRFGIAQRG